MADTIHNTLVSMRLKVICLGVAGTRQPEVTQALRETRGLLLLAREKAAQAEDHELADGIGELLRRIEQILESRTN